MARDWLAPAKLNLYLHITGRRADGLHLLDGLVAFASVCDALSVAPAATTSLDITGPFAARLDGAIEDNLVWRAADALAQRLGRRDGAAITLTKNLPVASGIGGGSSDAAAALRALAALWRCDDDAVLQDIAGALGSDVPVCLAARPAWIGDIGDAVEPAGALPACGVVLVNPLIPLPTASVYRGFRGPFSPPARFAIPTAIEDFIQLLRQRGNDLTTPAIARLPVIGTMLDRLAALDGAVLARMSGSGATCFALFDGYDAAEAAARRLQRDHPDWWIAAATLGGRDIALSAAAPGSTS